MLDLEDLKNKTDNQIREFASKFPFNGGYLTHICKTCGSLYADENAQTKNAKIITVCNTCAMNKETTLG